MEIFKKKKAKTKESKRNAISRFEMIIKLRQKNLSMVNKILDGKKLGNRNVKGKWMCR